MKKPSILFWAVYILPAFIFGNENQKLSELPNHHTILRIWAMMDQFLNSTIHEMLDNPRARLFNEENHWGEIEDYYFLRNEKNGISNIQYGRIINGHPTKLRHHRPFLQLIPKYEFLGNTTINLTQTLMQEHKIFKSKFISSSVNNFSNDFNKKSKIFSCKIRKYLNTTEESKKNNTDSSNSISMTDLIRGALVFQISLD
ncbi:unnamed protein product [Allacma fusca]|uniref:Uncharacterized protein n=1 Tax=Allacma fusca TaxID=39272 RepID=A0A8J2PDB5_9HEXA|nr:unnamed protein product [Allacma fusca]